MRLHLQIRKHIQLGRRIKRRQIRVLSQGVYSLQNYLLQAPKNGSYKISRSVYLDKVFHPYNKNQPDALFTFNLFQQLTSTCFEQPYCSSSGGTTLYTYTAIVICYAFILTGCWQDRNGSGWNSSITILPTASQHKRMTYTNCDIWLTVHISIILVINQQNAQILFYNKLIIKQKFVH